ncbi:GDSL-type esterase/lipase family protein [Runella slithyformis]|uniref:Lipolytic protein G-D-S-L family n=1 Tax=Runella slithyformis (strain ATCC 29530 / DSM 19594 / LMG 11500 / NCIMB 11436 / LSU 4) TaxID=761193 RepID=A0A7U4E465_RUNSL|nr:GDSL-type esterase/lipase family protein [Runella slithyformis]AEI46739.1 lipolytic protein G-D-S-L family [Runella slithyformis DSM 19594]
MKKKPFIFSIVLAVMAFAFGAVMAQNSPKSPGTFELKDNDRVVFLGNSLFENELQYGYLELALTTRWPGRNVTFRNLGWTGDNVWGEARSTFTNPPTPYQHLMTQITNAKPTLVFVAYGGVEAQEGAAGLSRFTEGLGKLIDKIDSLGAKTILLSPIPIMYEDTAVHVAKRNADLTLYASAIAKMAAERGKQFIDIYAPISEFSKKTMILENGVHLNELGYYYLASVLEKNLGLDPLPQPVSIAVAKNAAEATGPAKILASDPKNVTLQFSIDEGFLPLPLPENGTAFTANTPQLKISGLKKGFYTLTTENQQIITASAQQWAQGVAITQGPAYTQAAQIREMILKKNEQFFFQYRPLNRTYILGFRSYEQGRHAKGLEEQSLIIKWLEGQIALHSTPKTRVYQLSPVK